MPRFPNPKVGDLLWILAGSALPALAYIGLALKTNVFGWIFCQLFIAGLPSTSPDNACEKKALQQLRSPDGVRIVVLGEEQCDFGFGVNSASTTVRLTLAAHPDQGTDLVFYDDYLRDDQHVGLAWLDGHSLRITLPLFFDMKILTQEADGVRLDIKFDPDDPAARVAWLAKMAEYRRAYDKYLHLEPPPSDPAAKTAWLAKDGEINRTLEQKRKELEAIESRR